MGLLRAIVGSLLLVVFMISMVVFYFFPLVPILFISYPAYRYMTRLGASIFETVASFLLEHVWGIRYVISGDAFREEAAIIASNHRTRLDWALLWPALLRFRVLHLLRIVLKSDLKRLPFLGWAAQMVRFIFLERKWEKDADHMRDMFELIRREDKYHMLIFPEGTDLHPLGIERSNKFAQANKLPEYKYVLHPRTKGFTFAVEQLSQPGGRGMLQSIYDVTLAYRGHIPQNEKRLVTGKTPSAVFVHVKRYAVREVPSQEAELGAWVAARFAEKEKALGYFYENEGCTLEDAYTHCSSASSGAVVSAKPKCISPTASYLTVGVFATCLTALVASLLRSAPIATWAYAVCTIVAFVTMGKWGGLDKMEIAQQIKRSSAQQKKDI